MIGIMADSHDNLSMVRQAVDVFLTNCCELVVHAGDIIAPFTAKELARLECPVKAVFGNCDGERPGLRRALESFGEIKDGPFLFPHQQRRIVLTHIWDEKEYPLEREACDIFIFGHSHRPNIEKRHNTIFINPGETGGWVYGKPSIALLNPGTLETEIISLSIKG